MSEWASLPDYPGIIINRDGTIIKLPSVVKLYSPRSSKLIERNLPAKQLTPSVGNSYLDRYPSIAYTHQDTRYNCLVHRLIALAFVPNPNPKEYDIVDHIDNDVTNFTAENLKWTNRSQNIRDTVEQKRFKTSRPHLTETDIQRIRECSSRGIKLIDIAEIFDTSLSNVKRILYKKEK